MKLILVEPQPLMLDALARQLNDTDDITVVATATTGAEGIARIQEHEPDLVLMAYPLPDMTEAVFLRALKDIKKPLVLLSSDHSANTIYGAMSKGAQAYLLKSSRVELIDAVRRVHAGEVVMCHESLTIFVKAVRDRSAALGREVNVPLGTPLTKREAQILKLLADGHSQTNIAKSLGLEPTTIKTHTRNIYKKLGAKNAISAVREAIGRGLVN